MFEIGDTLRATRERQGIGYPEVELATKIRAKYVRALEEEDFDALPGDAYTRGFLRTYADYLGLDGDVYVDEYASRNLNGWRDELAPARERRHVRRRERAVERRAVVLVLVGIVLVTVLVFVAWRYAGSSPHASAPPKHGQKHAAPPVRQLVLHGVGRGTYVEVRRNTASGSLLLQGTLAKDEIDKLTGSHFYLLVRRSPGVRLTLDGRAVALPAAHNLRVLVTPQRTTRLRG